MKNKNSHTLAIIAVTIGNAIWGVTFLFTKIGLNAAQQVLGDKSGVMLLLAVRFIIATIGMLISYTFRKRDDRAKVRTIFTVKKPAKAYIALIITSLLSLAYYFFETKALEYTTSCYTGVALAIVPVFSIIPSFLILKEKPTLNQVLMSLIPISGVIMLTIAGGELGIISFIAILLILATCFVSAFYKTFNKLSSIYFSAKDRNLAFCTAKMLVFVIIALCTYDFKTEIIPLILNPSFVLPAAFLAIVSSIIADICVNYAAGQMSVMECASYVAVSTLFSAVAGFIFLDEPMNLLAWIGAAVVIIGVLILTLKFNNQELNIHLKIKNLRKANVHALIKRVKIKGNK